MTPASPEPRTSTRLRRVEPRPITRQDKASVAADNLFVAILGTIGTGIIFAILFVLFPSGRFGDLVSPWLLGVELLLGLGVFAGIATIAVLSLKLAGNRLLVTKAVTCPFCDRFHDVLASVHWFKCFGCDAPIYCPRDYARRALAARCAHCGRRLGLVDEARVLHCEDCQASLGGPQGDIAPIAGGTAPCPECGRAMPRTAAFCTGCDYIRRDAYASKPSPEERLRLEPLGNLKLGQGRLLLLADQLIGGRPEPNPGLQLGFDLAADVVTIAESFEEAATEDRLAAAVARSLRELDCAWARVLLILWATSRESAVNRTVLDMDVGEAFNALMALVSDVRLATVERLGARVPSENDQIVMSWNKNLVQWLFTGRLRIDGLAGLDGLLREAMRLDPSALESARQSGWLAAEDTLRARQLGDLKAPSRADG